MISLSEFEDCHATRLFLGTFSAENRIYTNTRPSKRFQWILRGIYTANLDRAKPILWKTLRTESLGGVDNLDRGTEPIWGGTG